MAIELSGTSSHEANVFIMERRQASWIAAGRPIKLKRVFTPENTYAPPAADLLPPALELISRHSPRLDPVATLQLLPPLVTAKDVRAFLLEALREPLLDTRVVRHVAKAREEQVARRLMVLQSKRVRITESRMYVLSFCFLSHSWLITLV